MKRIWTLHRQRQEVSDAARRWDRAYQTLLARPPVRAIGGSSYSNTTARQEVTDADRTLCPGLNRPSDPGPDH
jgi:hypothetical protein